MFTENDPPYNVIVNETNLQSYPYKMPALKRMRQSASWLWLVLLMFFVQIVGYFIGYSTGFEHGVKEVVDAPVNFAFRPLEPLLSKLEVVDELSDGGESANEVGDSEIRARRSVDGNESLSSNSGNSDNVTVVGGENLVADNFNGDKVLPTGSAEVDVVRQALIEDADKTLESEGDNKIAKIVLSETSNRAGGLEEVQDTSRDSEIPQTDLSQDISKGPDSLKPKNTGKILVTTKHLGVLEDHTNGESTRLAALARQEPRVNERGDTIKTDSRIGDLSYPNNQRKVSLEDRKTSPVNNLAAGYYVQVAVAATEKDASITMNKLKRSGFPAIIEESRAESGKLTYYRVLLGPEANRTISERMSAQVAREPYIKARPFVRLLD